MSARVLLATRSQPKAREIRRILATVPGLELVSLDDIGLPAIPEEDKVECYDTFLANATAKAKHFVSRSQMPVIADDSGIEVMALGGAPGVRSKRFAPVDHPGTTDQDEANNQMLLERLEGVPPEQRTARYVCVAVLAHPNCRVLSATGYCYGRILDDYRGDGGFGYDPLFFVPELGRTFAEVEPEVKNRLSHRGQAFRNLANLLRREQ